MKTLPILIRFTLCGALLGGAACSQSTQTAASDSGKNAMNMLAMSGGAPSIAKMKFTPYLPHPYPFATDLVSGAPLGADAISFVEGDYEVKVANPADEDAIKKSPDAYVEKIKRDYQTAKPSPLTACPVCGMDIDEGDLPFVYEGRQFQVCDASELAVFEKDPATYVKMWDDAEKAMTAKK